MSEEHETLLARHADKGSWKINEEELRARLPEEEANLVIGVLQREFPGLTETPLKLEGLQRSIKLGDQVFEMSPKDGILVVADSGKDRAQLTRAIATARIAQLETKYHSSHPNEAKRVDMLRLEGDDIAGLLKDSDDATWGPYAEKIKTGEASESEALFRWLAEMNKPDSQVDPKVAPQEAARRYREFVQLLHRENGIKSNKPVVLLGVGHSGSLGQVKWEERKVVSPEDTPQFCEIFKFDGNANLEETRRVKV